MQLVQKRPCIWVKVFKANRVSEMNLGNGCAWEQVADIQLFQRPFIRDRFSQR